MKKRLFGVCLAAMMIGATVPAYASETEAVAVEVAAAENIVFTVGETEITVVNESGVTVDSVEVKDATEDGTCTLVLVTADGTHTYEEVKPESWKEPKLIESFGFFYIRHINAEGASKDAIETGELRELEEPVSMWAVGNVNMRADSSADSEVVGVLALGDECKLVAVYPGWSKIEYNDLTGFVNHKYISAAKEDAEAAVDREEAAVAAAAAAAAAQQSYSYDYSYSGGGSSGGGAPAGGEECLVGGLLN